MDIARKLVEHHDLGQPALHMATPGCQARASSLGVYSAKAFADQAVKARVGLPPLGRLDLFEPESQHVGIGQHQQSPGWGPRAWRDGLVDYQRLASRCKVGRKGKKMR